VSISENAGPRPWVLAETSWSAVRETEYDLALLPWGATEPHNLHLPYGTDSIQAEAVSVRAAAQAWERGVHALVLPTVPFGVNSTQLGLGPTLHMSPTTQLALLHDVARSLEAADIARLVILNGHGGNDFKPLIREAQLETDVFLCSVDWWKAADGTAFFDEPGDHAGELETSVMLSLWPDMVPPRDGWGDGAARGFTAAGFREGWAWAPRDWRAVTEDTGVGDPRPATAEKGAAFLDAAIGNVASFLVELGRTPLGGEYGDRER
jgi:creatinine amidohydrolase